MAKIEDLIAEIADERLRAELSDEVQRLKSAKKFGLVFENHIPELSYLHGANIRRGVSVVKRGAKGSEVFRVTNVTPKDVTITRDADSTSEVCPASDLIVVKRYGEAIYPSLVPVESVTKNPSKPYHTIINSDNYHALQLLLYCYEGKFDVIYIDPPYNTGARDWKYNNAYVDSNDQWRHSKWLSFMHKRLKLARRLLRSDGIIIIAIDDWEYASLTLLMDEVFSGWSKHTVVTVVNPRGKGGAGGANFSRVHEYLLVCVAPGSAIQPLPKNMEDQMPQNSDDEIEMDAEAEQDNNGTFLAPLRRWGQGSRRKDRVKMFFPIFVNKNTLEIVEVGTPMPLEQTPEPYEKDNIIAVYPIDKKNIERRWRYGYEGVLDELEEGNLVAVKVKDKERIEIKRKETPTEYVQWKTLWNSEEFAGSSGARFLKYIFGRDDAFPYPKSMYATAEAILTVIHNRPNALVLDFFAGSGTTLQSVCYLNALYGGSRRCVLVSNNEVEEDVAKKLIKNGVQQGSPEFERHGICASVTFPRCKYVINGQRDDGTPLPGNYLNGRKLSDGFDENLAYFKLDFLDPNEVAYGSNFKEVIPILWLMAGAQGELEVKNGTRPYFIPKNSAFAVLIKESRFEEFKHALEDRPDITHVFLVTDSEEAFREMSEDISKAGRQTIMLYKNYLDNFRINIERTL
jgi:adenine-specific DNA-methyltransferase